MTNGLRAVGLLAVVAAGCAPGPLNKPIKQGSVSTGPGTLAEARKYLEGRWKLVSYVIRPPGQAPIDLISGGSGTLAYDGFGNLDMQIRVTDAKIADDLRRAGIPLDNGVLSTMGRVAIDMQAHTLTFILEGQSPLSTSAPSGPLAMTRPRYWEVNDNILMLTTRDDAGQPVSVGRWEKEQAAPATP
jgi:hypothetical protein